MAGTVTVSRLNYEMPGTQERVQKVSIAWTADASAATVPNTSITGLYGYLIKAVTNPGSTAPTDNYDITLNDPDDTSFDALGGKLIDRDTVNTEQVYPVITGAVTPVFLCGDYTLTITGNAVNSATGLIVLYLKENL